MGKLPTNRGFWLTFLLIIVTFGIYALYLVHAFAKETNIACKDDGKKTQGLLLYFLLTIVTLGIYSIVWYVLLIGRRRDYLLKHNKPEGLSVGLYLLTFFLLGNITLGIMHLVVFAKILYQQNAVNQLYNELTFGESVN